MKAFLLLFFAAIFSTIGNLLLKANISFNLSSFPEWLALLRPLFLIAVFFYMLNLVLFSKALEFLPVNIGYPVLASLGFIILSISSAFFFKETMTSIQIIGLMVVIVGIFMLAG